MDHIIGTDDAMDGEYMPVAEESEDAREGFEGELSVHKVVNGQSHKVSVSEILPTRVRIQQLYNFASINDHSPRPRGSTLTLTLL